MADKIALRTFIQECVDEAHAPAGERCAYLAEVLSGILGKEVDMDDRGRESCFARSCIIYEMVMEGYSTTEIGKALHRDHATVINGRRRIADTLEFPSMYASDVKLWERFKSAIV